MVCDFEIKGGKECEFRRSGMKVVVNEGEFMVGIGFEVEEFLRKVVCMRFDGKGMMIE